MFAVAERLGMPVSEVLDRVGWREFQGWIRYLEFIHRSD